MQRNRNNQRGRGRGAARRGKERINRRITNTSQSIKGQPARKTVWLEYHANYPLGSAADQTYGEPLILNGPFSPDPGTPSLTTPTFQFNANGYSLYRVESARVKLEVLNRETFGGQAYILIRDTAIGAVTGGAALANIQEYAAQGMTRSGFMGNNTSQPKTVLRMTANTREIVGEVTKFDDSYRSLTNSIPSNLVWVILGLYMDSVVSLGVSSYLFLQMKTTFFGFIGIAVTQEELGMCAGCRTLNQWLDTGKVTPCCSQKRTCNNCGANIPCSRGSGVTPHFTCEKLREEKSLESHQRVEQQVSQQVVKTDPLQKERRIQKLSQRAQEKIECEQTLDPDDEPEFEIVTPAQKKHLRVALLQKT